MSDPAVDVRPIRQVSGESQFNEVFFTNLRVSDSQRLGEIGAGWQVSLTTLMNERQAIGTGMTTGFWEMLDYTREAETDRGEARTTGATDVDSADVLWQVEAGLNGRCVQLFSVRRADRREQNLVGRATGVAQGVPRRLDRHRGRIFVVAGHRALTTTGSDRLAGESKIGYVRSVADDSGQNSLPLLSAFEGGSLLHSQGELA